MAMTRDSSLLRLAIGTSALALAVPQGAMAQDQAQPSEDSVAEAAEPASAGDEIVVTGIRASLNKARDIKRNAQGVVDAISAEDIGKFPDTNLAESLQRITGVSIDRSVGEGSTVTVRGFGPEFNLVLLNGRQMPTSTLGDGGSPPSSRSFDFANLAAEGVAAVEVYKSGRASLPTGGIGSVINILTPRPLSNPGLRGSVSVKGVIDTSRNGKNGITPEISGIVSDTFADDRVGIAIIGSWQKRKAGVNQANVGWRDGYLGSENNWGSLPQPGDPRYANIINDPADTDVYEVPQNASYDITNVDRTRLNGQAILQVRPTDTLTATVDFTYSRNTVKVRNSNVGIWFNFNDVSSEWTDGPVAGPVFYSEAFGANENKDLSYSGSLTANRTVNKSLGANLAWQGIEGLTLELDGHHSTAESKPVNEYGTSMSVGTAVFGIQRQTIDFTSELPVISVAMHPGIDPLDPANIRPTGNAFRNAYFKDRINQAQLKGRYDFDMSFLDSIDFGVSYVDNKVRSAFGFIQNDTWGGTLTPAQTPDDLFSLISLDGRFPGLSGANDPDRIPAFFGFNFEEMVDFLEDQLGICSDPAAGSAEPGTCLANFTVDRRIREKTLAPYAQANLKFDLFNNPANLRAGLRYEKTKINSSALVPIPSGLAWVGDNELQVRYSSQSDFTSFKGEYEHWLPAVDFDMSPIRDVKLRASYSHTITRPDYASLQGGQTIDSPVRIGGGTGSRGNPALQPYKSKNIDLSAEWYYQPASYLSVGYFRKRVSNFISQNQIHDSAFDLRNPAAGPRFQAAVAALGAGASLTDIRNYIIANYPGTVDGTAILSQPDDPLVDFTINVPVNSDQRAKLYGWEFAIQHTFWDTGFGAILNYTIVDGDAKFDNSLSHAVTQFALTGLSDSANAVLFYDKKGLQARVAYNWRDKFLAGTGPNPFYVEAYGQVDASASYEFRKGLTVFVEGINLTGSSRRGHRRHENNVFFASPGYARYTAGVRFNF
jgi:TonB-dependent receptor